MNKYQPNEVEASPKIEESKQHVKKEVGGKIKKLFGFGRKK